MAAARRGADRSSPESDDLPAADPYEVARAILLRKLEQRARSRAELAQALADRGVPAEVAEAILGRFGEVGLVDDRAFARSWSESRQRTRQLSRSAIVAELVRKGVDREVIEEATGSIDRDAELANAREFARRKARSLGTLEPDVARRRLAGALGRRGYPSSIVWQVTSEVLGRRADASLD